MNLSQNLFGLWFSIFIWILSFLFDLLENLWKILFIIQIFPLASFHFCNCCCPAWFWSATSRTSYSFIRIFWSFCFCYLFIVSICISNSTWLLLFSFTLWFNRVTILQAIIPWWYTSLLLILKPRFLILWVYSWRFKFIFILIVIHFFCFSFTSNIHIYTFSKCFIQIWIWQVFLFTFLLFQKRSRFI